MTRKVSVRIEPVEKVWLSTKEAAECLGVSKGYIADLRRDGKLPHSMIGNMAFFKKRDIDRMLERNRVY